MLSRRHALAALTAASALPLVAGRASAQAVSATDLAEAGPLGDSWLGPATAKVTIVEYASLTCSHCATFHATTFKEMKARWIDSGRVRFALREFPLDPLATAGFMLARADGGTKYYPVTDLLFDTQKSWAFSDKPLDTLRQIMRQAGFSQEKFDATLRDQKLYEGVNAVKNRAAERFKVESTPTFFVNGQRRAGALSIDELDKMVSPLLGA